MNESQQEVTQALERIAADPEESARAKAEIELWENGTVPDYRDEEW